MWKFRLAVVALLAALGAAVSSVPAHAYWRGGFWIAPVPFVVAPPIFYPPAYYPPPPPYYVAPPPTAYMSQPAPSPAPGQTCYAGPYVCPLDRVAPINAPCTCPGNGGRVPGNVR